MKTALQAGDIPSAVNYFSTSTRESYRQQFHVLNDTGILNDAASGMGDFKKTKTFDKFAQGEMVITEDGVATSYFVLFVKDDDGIWRIKSF
jgi:sucrose-6-phosphate hydrolase SacC (GH32 family)